MHPINQTELEIRERVWVELEQAVHERQHGWRTPVLATVDIDGTPNARTVVLRHVDTALQQLQFYTDCRSPKIAELMDQPGAMLVFWSKSLSWQLRVRVEIAIQTTGAQVDTVWNQISQSTAAGDYLSIHAPGDALAIGQAVPVNETDIHHLAILVAWIKEIDWLELSPSGHRRASFCANRWKWRTP